MPLLPSIIVLSLVAILLFSLLWLGKLPKKSKQLARVIGSLGLSIARGLAQDKYLRRYALRHPRQIDWLHRRLKPSGFNGLTLSLLSLAFIYILFQLAGVTEDFVKNDAIVAVDQRLDQLILLFRSPFLVKIFLWITSLGRWQTATILGADLITYCWLNRKKAYILPFIATYAGAGVTSMLGKLAIHRVRPPFPVYHETSYSFPSGHATAAIAIYGFLLYFLMRQIKNRYAKISIIIINSGTILAIGLSRIYLGVHYLSDVLAGYLLGLLWLIIGISMAEWSLSRKKESPAQKEYPQNHLNNFLIAIIAVFLVAGLAFSYRPTESIDSQQHPLTTLNNFFDLPAGFALPRFTETLAANTQEPISFIIAAHDGRLSDVFGSAGWIQADSINHATLGKMALAALLNRQYPQAPMTPSFWNGVPHDFGFEKSTAKQSFRQRHHARFWISNLIIANGKIIYVGTASYDSGLKWGLTHRIAPDIDTERELLFQDLLATGQILRYKKIDFVKTTLGKNFTGDQFYTDGQAYVIELK